MKALQPISADFPYASHFVEVEGSSGPIEREPQIFIGIHL